MQHENEDNIHNKSLEGKTWIGKKYALKIPWMRNYDGFSGKKTTGTESRSEFGSKCNEEFFQGSSELITMYNRIPSFSSLPIICQSVSNLTQDWVIQEVINSF